MLVSRKAPLALTVPFILALAGPAGAETARQPLSAIDWLSRSVTDPAAAAPRRPAANEPAVVASATVPPITTRVLGGPTLDGLGILSPEASGLPHDLWGASPSEELVRLIRTERVDTLPSIQALLMTLLLAELAPPDDATQDGALFLARIDKLLDLGAHPRIVGRRLEHGRAAVVPRDAERELPVACDRGRAVHRDFVGSVGAPQEHEAGPRARRQLVARADAHRRLREPERRPTTRAAEGRRRRPPTHREARRAPLSLACCPDMRASSSGLVARPSSAAARESKMTIGPGQRILACT